MSKRAKESNRWGKYQRCHVHLDDLCELDIATGNVVADSIILVARHDHAVSLWFDARFVAGLVCHGWLGSVSPLRRRAWWSQSWLDSEARQSDAKA